MKLVSYAYELDGHIHYLYVDEDFADSQLPPEVKTITAGRTKAACSESVMVRFDPKDKEFLQNKGYLDVCHYFTESEATS